MKSELSKNFSLVVIVIFFIGFAYITIKALQISNKTQISTGEGIYTNKVSTSKEIASKAQELTKNCKSELCDVQSILDYVTHIPYKINHFRANSPQRTIQNNFGDCEIDTVIGLNHIGALVTAVDRKSKCAIIKKVSSKKVDEVTKQLAA